MTGRTAGEAVELLAAGTDVGDRQQWLNVRSKGVTASEIAAIMGFSSYQSALGLYLEKRGEMEPQPDNPRMALGRHLEGFVCEQFAERHPEFELQRLGLARHKDRMWQMATCDRIAVRPWETDSPVPVEAKTSASFDHWGPDDSDVVPLWYRCQLLWQMDVLGADHGFLVCLFLLTQDVRVYEIGYDADDVGVLREAAQDFLRRLDEKDAPPPDKSLSSRRALKHLYPLEEDVPDVMLTPALIRSYRAAQKHYSEAADRKDLMDNRMRLALGQAKAGYDPRTGDKVVSRSVYPVNGYWRKPGVVDRLNYRKDQG